MSLDNGMRTSFFDLPPVIRQNIYYRLLSPKGTYRSDTPVPYYDFHPAILSVSRRCRQDAGGYLRLYCQFALLEFTMSPFWHYDDFFRDLPVIRGLPKSLVPDPTMTMSILGVQPELNNHMHLFAGPEALMYVAQGYWRIVIACKSTDEERSLLDPRHNVKQLRDHVITLTVHVPNLTKETQMEFLGPFMRIHQNQKHNLRGHVDPSFFDLFEREFSSGHYLVNDDHYIKSFFADYSRKARQAYRDRKYMEAYQKWDTLDSYWLYLFRLAKDDRKFRSVVRYMTSVFASYRLEMYLGCAMSALHFGEWNLAREAASRPYTREPRMRTSDLYKHIIYICRWFTLLCEGKILEIKRSNGFKLVNLSEFKQIRNLMLDLLTVRDAKGEKVGDYDEFGAWKFEKATGRHTSMILDVFADGR